MGGQFEVTNNGKCEDHKETVSKIQWIESKLKDLEIEINRLQDNKADRKDLYELKDKINDLKDLVSELRYSIIEIKNNSQEDRDTIKKLTEELSELNIKYGALEKSYDQFKRTNDKMDLYFEMNPWYQIGKGAKATWEAINKQPKPVRIIFKMVLFCILLSALFSVYILFKKATNGVIDLSQLIELAKEIGEWLK